MIILNNSARRHLNNFLTTPFTYLLFFHFSLLIHFFFLFIFHILHFYFLLHFLFLQIFFTFYIFLPFTENHLTFGLLFMTLSSLFQPFSLTFIHFLNLSSSLLNILHLLLLSISQFKLISLLFLQKMFF